MAWANGTGVYSSLDPDDDDDDTVEETLSEVTDSAEPQGFWQRLVAEGHKNAELLNFIVIGVILLNTVVIALEADHPDYKLWPIIENAFLVFFLIELTVRLIVDGPVAFFCGSKSGESREAEANGLRPGQSDGGDSRIWNIIDFGIVMLGVLDQWVLKALQPDSDRGKMGKLLSTFRVIRILRILRMVRLFRMFPQLFMLASGLMESLKTVFWITVLFIMVIGVFAILCTSAMRSHPVEEVRVYFGTVGKSMVTLFQFVTLDDWSRIARLVSGFSEEDDNIPSYWKWMMCVFIFYVLLTAFSILSLLTGVISEHMIALTRYTEKQAEEKEEEERKKFIDFFHSWFIRADTDNSGTVSREELRALFRRMEVAEELEKLEKLAEDGFKIEAFLDNEESIDELFDSILASGHDEVSWEDFCQGFLRMRGEAKGIHLLEVQSELRRLRNDLGLGGQQATMLGALHAKLSSTQKLLADLQTGMHRLEHKVHKLHRGHMHPGEQHH